jgi:hypothetical protein
MSRKVIAATITIALLAGPAYSQTMSVLPDFSRHLTPEEAEREKAIERDYNATTKKIPDKKAPADPWGNVRSAPTKSSASKPQAQ